MAWTETKSNISQVYNSVLEFLKKDYRSELVGNKILFFDKDGNQFMPCLLGTESPFNCFVIEHLKTGEDGDEFYSEDYNSLEELYQAVVNEIEE